MSARLAKDDSDGWEEGVAVADAAVADAAASKAAHRARQRCSSAALGSDPVSEWVSSTARTT